uniref:Uncharacterized protein n=1 Tax=Oryza glumipatula TaxID=40148 RepID=A0A0E0AJ19_9ORYZ
MAWRFRHHPQLGVQRHKRRPICGRRRAGGAAEGRREEGVQLRQLAAAKAARRWQVAAQGGIISITNV